jgi:hypothetical protein
VITEEAKADRMLEIQSAIGRRMSEAYGLPEKEKRDVVEVVAREILDWLRGWTAISKRSVFAIGGMLYWAERFWGMLTPLHPTHETFDEFAREETGLGYSTYRAWIAIYRAFIVNEFQHPRIVAEGPAVFLDVPVGKLERAVSKVRRGEMQGHHWDALFDPQVSDREFWHIVSISQEEKEREDEAFIEGKGEPRVAMDDKGDIRLWRGPLSVRIGWLDVISQDGEVREAVDHIVEQARLR